MMRIATCLRRDMSVGGGYRKKKKKIGEKDSGGIDARTAVTKGLRLPRSGLNALLCVQYIHIYIYYI